MKKLLIISIALSLPMVSMAQSMDDLSSMVSSEDVQSVTGAMGGSLSGLLESSLGLSSDQAEGGIGSVLALANEKLNAGDFDQLAASIPGADSYLEKAKSLGAVTGKLGNVDGLKNSLSSLGIPPETVDQFLPMVVEYGGKLGGENTQKLLQQVLGS